MDMDTAVLVANAPVSYGAFERTIGMPGVPTGEDVLSAVAGAGYAGIDLGPVGFLGRAEELRAALVTHGLGLAGGYVELPFTDPASLRGAWHELDAVLDQFDAAASLRASHPPRPTLACAPTPERVAHPGQAARNRSLALDAAARSALAAGVAEALDRCLARGYPPTFHPELGTDVEAPDEIETLLDVTEIGLCLDTGHFSPPAATRSRPPPAGPAGSTRSTSRTPSSSDRGGRPSRGTGRCRLEPGGVRPWARGTRRVGRLEALHATGYRGWIVVEQDSLPGDAATFATAAGAQREHRRILERSGF